MPGADTDHDVGRVLGRRYRLEHRIGIGASAVVYRATDLNLRRSVAVKQLKPELSGDSRFIKLFRSEAHLAGQLGHPNVLTIHDWSADDEGSDGGAYIVTEQLTGGTLRQVLDRRGPLPVEEAAGIGIQVARGLRAAHEAGLVHRDIKPGNLLFSSDGVVKIGDFGIARAVAEAAWTEPEGHLIGTARYAAPEQGQPGEVNGRADIYSLAVCLIEMVTGDVPLVGESALATMMMRLETDLPVDPTLGPMADVAGWAGLAEWAARPSAEQLVEELACIPGVAGQAPVPVDDAGGGRGGGGGANGAHGATSALSDRTADDYLTSLEPTDGHRRWSWRALGLVLFAVATAGAVAGGWFLAQYRDNPTESIQLALPSWPVPDFTGQEPDEARAAVEPFGWTVTVEERHNDGTVDGELLEQRPPPGEILGPGASIELVLSLGPVPRQVPEIVGRPEVEVRRALAAARLTVGTVTEANSEDVEPGLVVEATIAGQPADPGAEHPTGTAVDLVISAGPAARVVPALAGSSAAAATRALEPLGLVLSVIEDYSETVPEGQIIGISPAPGTEVQRGATITATVSLGLPLVEIPDLAGRPVLEAADELSALGFTVRIEGAAEANVLGTRPLAGTSARLGSSVTIVSTQE
mgnify:CR=1 FL=1